MGGAEIQGQRGFRAPRAASVIPIRARGLRARRAGALPTERCPSKSLSRVASPPRPRGARARRPRGAVHCGCLLGAQQARAGAIDASRPQLSNHVWVGGAHRHPFPSNFQLNHSGADLRHKNSCGRIASNTPTVWCGPNGRFPYCTVVLAASKLGQKWLKMGWSEHLYRYLLFVRSSVGQKN